MKPFWVWHVLHHGFQWDDRHARVKSTPTGLSERDRTLCRWLTDVFISRRHKESRRHTFTVAIERQTAVNTEELEEVTWISKSVSFRTGQLFHYNWHGFKVNKFCFLLGLSNAKIPNAGLFTDTHVYVYVLNFTKCSSIFSSQIW